MNFVGTQNYDECATAKIDLLLPPRAADRKISCCFDNKERKTFEHLGFRQVFRRSTKNVILPHRRAEVRLPQGVGHREAQSRRLQRQVGWFGRGELITCRTEPNLKCFCMTVKSKNMPTNRDFVVRLNLSLFHNFDKLRILQEFII